MSGIPGSIGLFDYTGIFEGARVLVPAPPPPPVGFLGLLDFTGIPVGRRVALPRKGHGSKVGGRRYYIHSLIQEMVRREALLREKSHLEEAFLHRSILDAKQKAFEREVQEIVARRTRIIAATAVILAEV